MKLLALFLLAAATAAAAPSASAAPAANTAVVYRRSCSECADDAGTYCEYNYPGSPEGAVACIRYGAASARALYRRYEPAVCPQDTYVRANFVGTYWAAVDGESYSGAGSAAVVFTTGPSIDPCSKITLFVATYQNTGTVGSSVTFDLDLRGVSGGLPSSALLASDSVSFTSKALEHLLVTKDKIPNIAGFAISPSTRYSLVMYNLKVGGSPSTEVSVLRNDTADPAGHTLLTQGYNTVSYVKDGAIYPGSIALSFGNY